MKKREIRWILIIIILFLVLISFSIYSKYSSQSQESEGTLNSLSSFLAFILEPFHLPEPLAPKPKGPYGYPILPPDAIDPNLPIPDDLNNPVDHGDDVPLPPLPKIDPNQKPTPAPPKPIYDFWKKFWESLYKLFNWKNN